jgi:hypothetical protein
MSSTNGKVKIYKNPERNRPNNLKPYVPQYQVMGLEPEEYNSPLSPGYVGKVVRPQPLPKDNPRAPRAMLRRQPYAEAVPSPVGGSRGLLPNVGNNIEHTWSSVDGEIVDDLTESVDPNQTMIDNNDYVSTDALGLPPDGEEMVVEESELEPESQDPRTDWAHLDNKLMKKNEKNFLSSNELQDALKEEYLSEVIKKLDEEEYLLIVDGAAICSGPMDDIQEQARALVFGEHPLCNGNPMSVDDIVVLKRSIIKVGLFLE